MSAINFLLLLALLNQTAVQAARVVLALFALDLGAQPFAVGILAGMFSAFPMLLAVPVGRIADRLGARRPLLFGSAVAGSGMLVAYFLPGLPAIFVAAAMMGMATAIYNVSLQNLAGLLSNPENRARNFSNYSLINSTGSLLGPLMGGFSIDHFGHDAACIGLGLISLALLVLLLFRRDAMGGGAHRAAHQSGNVRELLSEPGLRKTLVTGSLQNSGDSLYQFYMPIYTHSLGMSASVIGVVLAMNAAAAFVVRLLLPRMLAALKEERLLAYAFYTGATALLLMPFFQSAMMLGVTSFIFGLGMGCTGPIVTMLMFGRSPPGRSGEALGLKVTVNHLTKVVGPVFFGSIAGAFGVFAVFWVNAMMLGTGGVLSQPKKAQPPQ